MKRNNKPVNGSQITNDYNKIPAKIERNKNDHRSKAEMLQRQSRKELIEYLYNQEKNNATGLTTTYKPEYAEQAYTLALLGATIGIMAMFFNTSEEVISRWGRENPAFNQAIKRGGIDMDTQIAERLSQRALGYDYKESETWQVLNKKTGEITTLEKHYNKHMAPDVTAQIFWLKNRQRGIWTDVSRTEMYNKVDIDIKKKIDLSVLSNIEVESVKQIAISMLSKDKGSMEIDKK